MQRIATAIEIEVRFLITHATRRQLQKLVPAAALERRKHLQYTDTYYDTVRHSLMLSDNWLRKREKEWQLKHAIAGFKSQEHSSGTYQYKETVGQLDILKHLKSVIPDVFGSKDERILSLDQMVSDGTLTSMAEFSTARESYKYDDGLGEVKIDLDHVSFGYAVGEVEVMVQSVEEIPAAKARAKAIASQLVGEECKGPPPTGKLSVFLSRNHPALWEQLVERGISGIEVPDLPSLDPSLHSLYENSWRVEAGNEAT